MHYNCDVRWGCAGIRTVSVLVVLVALGCTEAAKEHPDAARACELLQTDRSFAAPAPATGNVDRSLRSLLLGDRLNSHVHGIVYVLAEQAEELDAVAQDIGRVAGIEVEEVVDQETTYDEFIELFADNEELVETVVPGVLPPSVRVTAVTDSALDELRNRMDQDARVYEVVDIREVAAATFSTIARRFDTVLEELVEATGGEARAAFEAVQTSNEQSLEDVVSTYRAIEDFVNDQCA